MRKPYSKMLEIAAYTAAVEILSRPAPSSHQYQQRNAATVDQVANVIMDVFDTIVTWPDDNPGTRA